MKKTIGILVVLGAVATGAYLYKGKVADSGNAMLPYVPADTVLLASGAADNQKLMELTRAMFPNMEQLATTFSQSVQDIGADTPEAATFFLDFMSRLLKASSDKGLAELGLSEAAGSVVYARGVIPVMRFALADSERLRGQLEAIDKQHGLTPATGTLEGVEYREYLITNQGGDKLGLVVATQDNQLVMALNTPLDDSLDLKRVFSKPERSIADSGALDNLADKYGYQQSSIFLLDIKGMVGGLTDPSSNGFGQMVQEIVESEGQQDALAGMRTEACKREYNALAAKWPMLSFGYTDIDSKSASYKMVLEGTDADLLGNLQRIQGHLTPMIYDQGLLVGMGMGLNVKELAPAIGEIWSRMNSEPFECESLRGMNGANPAMGLGMVGGMLNGVKGISVGAVDMDLDAMQAAQVNPMAAFDKLNLVVSISADDPKLLLQSLSTFQPELANLNLQDGGALVDVPMPMPVPIKVGLRGHDLVLAMGEKAHAIGGELPSNTDLPINGMFSIAMDIGRYFELLGNAVVQQSIPESEKALFDMFKGINGHYQEKYLVTDQGFEVTGRISVEGKIKL